MPPDPTHRERGLRAAATQRARREVERRERWASRPPLGYSLTSPSAAFLLELLEQRARTSPDVELRALLLAWKPWPPSSLLLALAELRVAGQLERTGPETYRLTRPGAARTEADPWENG